MALEDNVSYDVPGYDGFRQRARDPGLSPNQRSGFPDALRAGRSAAILEDIAGKLPAFERRGAKLLDIGPGCGELALHIIDTCGQKDQSLTLVDSPEMLDLLPGPPHVTKVPGPFPACRCGRADWAGRFDAILVYSVIQYVFAEGNFFGFADSALELLGDEGALLIGDVPNSSMRKRFLASENGKAYHVSHYPDCPQPDALFNTPEPGRLDDAVILGLVARARAAGFQAFAVPQGQDLPSANRREDILIRRA